ncbi:Wadjet anti-phage system protein JetD domain-containing protein [Blautia sp.]|uniref:Wadjet anti-phage system protein JetD domain-containing protein n=1 Tax=Blautia sp. TaxID=1955243 RepID=UPI00257D883E|nr:Wadjet anti-phage system protein JetD domain-containing protein [Blautia sp.]
MRYEERILQTLLDSYERSRLSRGENEVAVHIAFPITPKTMPIYFDENSLAYEEIHGTAGHLEEMGYTCSVWKGGKKNHILQKIVLCDEKVDEIYRHLGRVPEKQMQQAQLAVLQELKTECSTPVARNFICWLMKRLEQGKTVKEYLNLDDTEGSRRLIRAIHRIETNQKEIYIREFSVQCFGDSKELEKKSGLIGKIFRRFSDDMEDMDNDVILAEYGIYRTPNYVYVKGGGRLRIGTPEAYDIDLRSLRQGIGLSGEDLDGLEWKVDVSVKRIITIENLTTFFRWEEPDSVLIYLGGYHNAVRRKFLQKLYQVFPEAEYFHFGDIDVGGFEIYEDLCRRTGIPFTTYKMGISELEQYEQYTRELTENDRKRMDSLLNNEAYENVWPILRYMKEHGKKLEQESIL